LVFSKKLDLNRVTISELESLPGIGKVLASRILKYRSSHGRFVDISELKNIKGIGEKKSNLLKKYLFVGSELLEEKQTLKSSSFSGKKFKVYYYIDENGTYHFTQFPERVPKKYKRTLRVWKK